ncbi:MAG: enoyl-CoA hydratase-related protein [Acidobacteriota bacterium]
MPSLLVTPGPVTLVTLNRPDVRNALDETLIAELKAWALAVPTDGSVRVAVLQGAGPAFCAGADLGWMQRVAGYSYDENVSDAMAAADLFFALDSLPVPLIGRVHGAAMGGGVGLVAVCDIVIAADDTTFGLTETRLGLVPAMISPYLVRKMGMSAARAWCLNGVRFGAVQAASFGLVHEVVPASQLDEAIDRAVGAFSTTSPAAVAATKRVLSQIAGKRPEDVRQLTAEAIATARDSSDGQEGLRAFFDKRPPAWTQSLSTKDPHRS